MPETAARQPVENERTDGLNLIRLNRPEKRNALSRLMYSELSAALRQGEDDENVAVHVIMGQPDVFCAGHDIADFLAVAKLGAPEREEWIGEVAGFLKLLPGLAKPLVCAVDGNAIGIGTTLLLHADLVYASRDSRFSTPFVSLGLVPEAGSSLLLPRICGHARSFELLVLGSEVDAEWMLRAGLVNASLPAAEVERAAIAAAQRLAAQPREAMMLAHRMLRPDHGSIVACIENELAHFKARLQSPEALAAFGAFLDRKDG